MMPATNGRLLGNPTAKRFFQLKPHLAALPLGHLCGCCDALKGGVMERNYEVPDFPVPRRVVHRMHRVLTLETTNP